MSCICLIWAVRERQAVDLQITRVLAKSLPKDFGNLTEILCVQFMQFHEIVESVAHALNVHLCRMNC